MRITVVLVHFVLVVVVVVHEVVLEVVLIQLAVIVVVVVGCSRVQAGVDKAANWIPGHPILGYFADKGEPHS